jgi:hypothetical protein
MICLLDLEVVHGHCDLFVVFCVVELFHRDQEAGALAENR